VHVKTERHSKNERFRKAVDIWGSIGYWYGCRLAGFSRSMNNDIGIFFERLAPSCVASASPSSSAICAWRACVLEKPWWQRLPHLACSSSRSINLLYWAHLYARRRSVRSARVLCLGNAQFLAHALQISSCVRKNLATRSVCVLANSLNAAKQPVRNGLKM
jgi:hypothetical protein